MITWHKPWNDDHIRIILFYFCKVMKYFEMTRAYKKIFLSYIISKLIFIRVEMNHKNDKILLQIIIVFPESNSIHLV